MKKAIYFLVTSTIVVGLLSTSCVPAKKLTSSEAKVFKLEEENALVQKQLKDCNKLSNNLKLEKTSLQNDNDSVQSDLNALSATSKMTIAEQTKRLKALQDIIQSQKDVMNGLKNSIADALINYQADELTVYIKDGNVYVSLEEKLLFKSGSDIVDTKGKDAIKVLAKVLSNTKNITVLIEGHTDDVPIKTAAFKDNWELSTARATSILRLLTTDNGFDPNRITASGRGQYHPIKTNTTTQGRAANRRTEIILSPDLKELYNLLYF